MKVLWLVNTPSNADKFLGMSSVSGGWIASLEKELIRDSEVHLVVLFYHNVRIEINTDRVKYIGIPRKERRSRIYKGLDRLGLYNDDKSCITQIVDSINDEKPNLIHIHGTEENFSLLLKERLNVPVLVSIQGLLGPIVNHYYQGIPANLVKRHEPYLKRLTLGTYRINYLGLVKRSLRESATLACVKYISGRTNWDKNVSKIIAKNDGVHYYHIDEILREPFYSNMFTPTKKGDELKVVTVISNGLYKGLDVLLRSLRILKEASDVKISCKIIGLSEEDHYVQMVQRALNFKTMPDYISFLGKKNAQEIVDCFSYSDLYVNCSYIENSSNSVCEALLYGIPVIASNVGGTSTLIKDNKEGLLFPSGDYYFLAACLLGVEEFYGEALKRAKLARDVASERHSKQAIRKSLLWAYKSILSHNSNKRNVE